jgi:glycerophosphoryl diester phosphodiesterase
MRRIGHRGAMGHAPENTRESFEKAIALGCDEVETDVWVIGARIVVAHDRPASHDGLLSIDDVLRTCKGRATVNVEVKSAGSEADARDAGRAVASHLADRGADAYVSSFWWSALGGAREAAPGVRRAFIYSGAPAIATLIKGAQELGLSALHPSHRYVTPELVAAAHAARLLVHAWTVNDPARIAELVAMGVDGIASDFPERVPKG